ncbi:MAG: hypothetical protein Q9219_002159 [cf. Caloplaca sp. 3 TL-2023]
MPSSSKGPAPGSGHGTPNGAAPANEAPKPDNNIMNIRGDMTSSLYQICLSLRRRLSHVPGFHQYLVEMDEEEADADGATDPVTSMWNCLRRGYPLMTIYNALQPPDILALDPNKVTEKQVGKAATFKFLQACMQYLKIPANECFLITDLYGGDTTGFVKVTKLVNRVLDSLDERGFLMPSDPRLADHDERPGPGSQITHIQHVVREIVQSERTYVQHLELLQQAKNEIETAGNVPGDSTHNIFLNLNALLDFQRRFLIRVEQQNSLPESQQNWGQLFIQYQHAFRVYEPFIANQTRCNETVTREWDKISATPHSKNLEDLFSNQSIFHGFCVKPFQRLSKYPLLLNQLGHKSQLDPDRKAKLIEGEKAANSLMHRANEAVAREQRTMASTDLEHRVEDWKGHNIKQFGELLLYGNYTVVKGEGTKPAEREVCVIFDTLPPFVRTYMRYAVGQYWPVEPPIQHSGNEAVDEDEEMCITSPGLKQRIRTSLSGLSSCKVMEELPPITQPRSDSDEGSPTKTHLTSSPSPKSPLFIRDLISRFKKPASQEYCSLGPHLPEFFFNSPIQAILLQNENKRHEQRSSVIESPKPSKGRQQKSHFNSMENDYITEECLVNPFREQYIIYLFERILLCCKEINPNKQRPKMLRNEKAPVHLHGKARLQLKGRIFMQNVTDVLSFVRTEKSSYTIQIFWKGDPGVENFIIRFSNESEMNRWRDQVQQQKESLGDSVRSSGHTGTSQTVFTSMRNRPQPENPYLQTEDPEDEIEPIDPQIDGTALSAMSRNASSNSLRTITPNQAGSGAGRGISSRLNHHQDFSAIAPPLSLNTNVPPGPNTPNEFPGTSYFSPAADSPSSTRSSSQATTYPFPRQATPNNWPPEDNKHKTAPAPSGASSRDGPGSFNTYQLNGRTVMRPSLPAMSPSQAMLAAQQLANTQSRMRSASTPNIHDPMAAQNGGPGARRYANGQVQPTIDNIPVPPIPPHMAQMRTHPNRSQNNSPTNGPLPIRNATQSPMFPRDRPMATAESNVHQPTSSRDHIGLQVDPRLHNQGGYGPAQITVLRSPPMTVHTTSENNIPLPSQLKVKIWFEPLPSHVTIVVPIVIKHRSLIDRIDSKMVKISSASISRGAARLLYRDMEDDMVLIASDEDIQIAIEDWGQVNEEALRNGDVKDFELHWEEKKATKVMYDNS